MDFKKPDAYKNINTSCIKTKPIIVNKDLTFFKKWSILQSSESP
jgi:hypothetical protein